MTRLVLATLLALFPLVASAQGILVEDPSDPKAQMVLQGPTVDPTDPDARYVLTYDAAGTPVWVKEGSLVSTLHPTFTGDLVYDPDTNEVSYTDDDPEPALLRVRDSEDGCRTEFYDVRDPATTLYSHVKRDEDQDWAVQAALSDATVTDAELAAMPVLTAVEIARDTITVQNPSLCRDAVVNVWFRADWIFQRLAPGNSVAVIEEGGWARPDFVADSSGATQEQAYDSGMDLNTRLIVNVPPGPPVTFDFVALVRLLKPYQPSTSPAPILNGNFRSYRIEGHLK